MKVGSGLLAGMSWALAEAEAGASPPFSNFRQLKSRNLTEGTRIPAWLNLKANLRVFVDSSGWPSAFCSWRLRLEAQSISSFTFLIACELQSSVGNSPMAPPLDNR